MHVGAIQGAELTQTLVATLKTSSNALKMLKPLGDVKDVEDVVFDLQEEIQKASEINDVLSKPISGTFGAQLSASGYGEEEVEAEFNEMMCDEQVTRSVQSVNDAPMLPNKVVRLLASKAPPRVPTDEDDWESGWGQEDVIPLVDTRKTSVDSKTNILTRTLVATT